MGAKWHILSISKSTKSVQLWTNKWLCENKKLPFCKESFLPKTCLLFLATDFTVLFVGHADIDCGYSDEDIHQTCQH